MDSPCKEPLVRVDFPVFVLGSARSGTSTMAHTLKETVGYDGFGEGHFFSLMHRILSLVDDHFVRGGFVLASEVERRAKRTGIWVGNTTAEAVSQVQLKRELIAVFRDSMGWVTGASWFDKTPGPDAIHAARVLLELYPRAKFVFMVRDPVANVASRLRKFPNASFSEHCRDWVECANAWLRVRSMISPGNRLEVRAEDLDRDPLKVWTGLMELLGDHPLGAIAASKPAPVRFPCIERTNTGDPAAKISLDEQDWSAEQKQEFLATCGALMEEFGYTLGGDGDRASVMSLPPPYGQKSVEVKLGELGGIWPQLDEQEMWIFMHPSKPGTGVTQLIYHGVELGGMDRLEARAKVTSDQAQPVRFTVRLLRGESEAWRADYVCPPSGLVEINEDVELDGPYDVEISTETTGDNVDNAWAMITPLRFERLVESVGR